MPADDRLPTPEEILATHEEVERVLRRVRRFDVAEIADWLESGDLDRSRLEP